ncbi:MAG: hypothetical protein HPY66_1482 [Firmicutes bacterium]|nr:hypothetical protein [Bacillota bacterium]
MILAERYSLLILAERAEEAEKEAISMARVIAALMSLMALVLAGGAAHNWH